MDISSHVALESGRVVTTDSAEFAEKMPITYDMLQRINMQDDDLAGVLEAIGAVALAVLRIEARGVTWDD